MPPILLTRLRYPWGVAFGVAIMAYQSTDQAAQAVAAELSEMFRAVEAMPVPQRFLSLMDDLEAQGAFATFEAELPHAVGF